MSSQTEKATSVLRDVAKQLHEGDTSGMVGTVLTEVGTRVQGLADALESKGPQGLLDDVRRYARRSPGTFLLGAALAGLVTGRLVKGLQAPQRDEQRALPAGPSAGTASGNPLAGVTSPGIGADVPRDLDATGTTYGAPSGSDAYAAPAYRPSTPPTAYPSGADDSPYSAGYDQTEPYGTRGAL